MPDDRLYTPSHFWLRRDGDAPVWTVGFTRFAVRMLGELVEHDWEAQPGSAVQAGQIIGWVEGFKAITDLYAVASGRFVTGNPALAEQATLIEKQPYDAGWLYRVEGEPDAQAVPVQGYVELLDAAIDRMQGLRHD